jgi:hypothetical protein
MITTIKEKFGKANNLDDDKQLYLSNSNEEKI